MKSALEISRISDSNLRNWRLIVRSGLYLLIFPRRPRFGRPWSAWPLFSRCPSLSPYRYRKCIQSLSQFSRPFFSCSCRLPTCTERKRTPLAETEARRVTLLRPSNTASCKTRSSETSSKRTVYDNVCHIEHRMVVKILLLLLLPSRLRAKPEISMQSSRKRIYEFEKKFEGTFETSWATIKTTFHDDVNISVNIFIVTNIFRVLRNINPSRCPSFSLEIPHIF